MHKRAWLTAGILILLAAGVALFALLNSQGLQSSSDDAVTVRANDQTAVFDIDDLKTLPKTAFTANLDTNGQAPVEKTFGGVPLIDVLNRMGVDINGASQIVFKAADGYTAVALPEEVKEPGNVYVVYERDGEPSGTMAQGGTGPIEIVIKNDAFSQRWCKFLREIAIE